MKALSPSRFSVSIQGAVEAGIVVRAGVTVDVNGALAGPVTIEEGASLVVQGAFAGEVIASEGMLVVSGAVVLDPAQVPGQLGVVVGTAITPDRTAGAAWQLQADGRLLRLEPGANINVDSKTVCVYEAGRFFPAG